MMELSTHKCHVYPIFVDYGMFEIFDENHAIVASRKASKHANSGSEPPQLTIAFAKRT